MVLAHDKGAVLLTGRHAFFSQRAALAVAFPPLKTVGDFGLGVLANPAATSAFVARRAVSALMSNVHREIFYRQAVDPRAAWAGRGRAHQGPAFLGGPMQPRTGEVPAVGIEFGGPFQAALGLRLQRLVQARLITLGGLLE